MGTRGWRYGTELHRQQGPRTDPLPRKPAEEVWIQNILFKKTRRSILGSVGPAKIGQRPERDLRETLERTNRDLSQNDED